MTRERCRASPFEDAAERRASQYEAHAPRTLPVLDALVHNGGTAAEIRRAVGVVELVALSFWNQRRYDEMIEWARRSLAHVKLSPPVTGPSDGFLGPVDRNPGIAKMEA
jgi:hypothetical protein